MRRSHLVRTLSLAVTSAFCLSVSGCSSEKPAPKNEAPNAAPAPVPQPVENPPPRAATPSASLAKRDDSRNAKTPVAEPAPAAPAEPAAPTTATLEFETDVPGVEVFIDRNPVGVTPLTVHDVKPGAHRLNMSAPGYEGVSESINVEAGQRKFVYKFKEVRLDLKTDVVHHHRMGSCKGTLIATQHGLKYDTTDKDDAFSAAITDIETLQIDYLQNRLRIGVRGGKKYEFSDPGGNADHLFVFHRDLEKARDRLKRGDPPAAQ